MSSWAKAGATTSRGATGSGSPAIAASFLSRLLTVWARWQNRSSQKLGPLNPTWQQCPRVDTLFLAKRARRSRNGLALSLHNYKSWKVLRSPQARMTKISEDLRNRCECELGVHRGRQAPG
jgi:hypothetical protein